MHWTRLIACACMLLMTGCESGGGGDDEPEHVHGDATSTVQFTRLRLTGTTDPACAVTANGIADDDGAIDSNWSVTLDFDDSDLPSYRSGTAYTTSIRVDAEDAQERIVSRDYIVSITQQTTE